MKNSFQNFMREAQFAGQFYPDNKIVLAEQLKGYFDQAEKISGNNLKNMNPRALIVPHAGYMFSGQVAASAYKLIPKNSNYKRVFVIASSHRYSFGCAAVFSSGNYKTPLGEIRVDTEFAKALIQKSDLFIEHNDAHENEHSLEVQLPFLQYKLGNDFTLIPIILGIRNAETCLHLANEMTEWFTEENLWVISTDFSHYPEYDDATKVDKLTAEAICSNDPEKLQNVLQENKNLHISNLATSLCGWTSVLTLLNLTKNKNYIYEKIYYQNSGDTDIYGRRNQVVGYWSIAVYGKENEFRITPEEKKELLAKARHSIETYVKTGNKSKFTAPSSNGILNEKTGAFVSVYIDGKLRGCIGGFPQKKTLNELVQDMAVSSCHDRRFEPVQPEELENMELEISVLSPLKKIESVDEIVLGKHGIYIRDGIFSGTFLPQVADKTNWTLEEFLGHCSRDKAGLGWDGWKKAEIYTYEAIIFKGV